MDNHISDFEAGAEPDVLFYFNGKDSNPFVKAGKVVTIDEIRSVYPDYASNMKDEIIPACPAEIYTTMTHRPHMHPFRQFWMMQQEKHGQQDWQISKTYLKKAISLKIPIPQKLLKYSRALSTASPHSM